MLYACTVMCTSRINCRVDYCYYYSKGGYATRHTKPKHKTVTRDGGYYNVYTDAVVKTKKLKTKGKTIPNNIQLRVLQSSLVW